MKRPAKLLKFAFLSIGSIFVSLHAHADQCTTLSKWQAEKAIEFLMNATQIHSFCEPCGDAAPVQVIRQFIGVQSFGSNRFVLQLNGPTVDAAYMYIDGVNLAQLVECQTKGVSQFLK